MAMEAGSELLEQGNSNLSAGFGPRVLFGGGDECRLAKLGRGGSADRNQHWPVHYSFCGMGGNRSRARRRHGRGTATPSNAKFRRKAVFRNSKTGLKGVLVWHF